MQIRGDLSQYSCVVNVHGLNSGSGLEGSHYILTQVSNISKNAQSFQIISKEGVD